MITDVIAAPAPAPSSSNSRGGVTDGASGTTFDSTLAGLSEQAPTDGPAQPAASGAKLSDSNTGVLGSNTGVLGSNTGVLLDAPTVSVADLLRGAVVQLGDAAQPGLRTPADEQGSSEKSGEVLDAIEVEQVLDSVAGAVPAEVPSGEAADPTSPLPVAAALVASNRKKGSAEGVETPVTDSTTTAATTLSSAVSDAAPAAVVARASEHVAPDGVPVGQGSDSADLVLPRQAHAVSTQPAPTAPVITGSGPTAPVVTGTAPTADGVTPTRGAVPVEAAAVAVPAQAEGSAVSHAGPTVEATAVVAPAPASGASAPTAATVPTAAPTSAPALPNPETVATQLSARLGALRAAPAGDHVLTIRVDPDSIGPVRVVAHIGTDGVRIELTGGTDIARDALRAALPDLRRDLAGLGLSADLDLADQPGFGGQARDQNGPQNGSHLAVATSTTSHNATEPRPGTTGVGHLDLEI